MYANNDFEGAGIFIAAVIVLGLSLAAPQFVALQLGYEHELQNLIDWGQARPLWIARPLLFLYGLIGFFGVVIAGSAICAAGYLFYRWVTEATFRLWEWVRCLVSNFLLRLAKVLSFAGSIVIGLLRLAGGFLSRSAADLWRRATRRIREAIELRRVYLEEYRDQFGSFREFKEAFDAANRDDDAAGQNDHASDGGPDGGRKTDLFATALLIFGLPRKFTRADLTRRYREMMKSAHPDVGGSHEHAATINWAHNLIKERMSWI